LTTICDHDIIWGEVRIIISSGRPVYKEVFKVSKCRLGDLSNQTWLLFRPHIYVNDIVQGLITDTSLFADDATLVDIFINPVISDNRLNSDPTRKNLVMGKKMVGRL
jgi:hypothetical protein